MDLLDAAGAAAAAVRAAPGRWFLATDTDADGIAAAAVAGAALRRAGHRIQIRAGREKTEAAYRKDLDEADGTIFLDKATSHLPLLAAHARATGRPVVVLDHHNLPDEAADGVHLVNPRAVGLDGSRDACSATVAVAFALALCGESALELAPMGLSGAIGDWQHLPRWQGWNEELVHRSLEAGHLRREPLPRLVGIDLADAVAHMRPPVPGLGDVAKSAAWLEALGIDPAAEAEELDREARTRLVSALALRHLGHDPSAVPGLVRETLWDVRLGTSLRHVFRIIDACGRTGHAAAGIAYLWGDAAAADEARGHFRAYKKALGEALEHLRGEGVEERGPFLVHWTRRPELTGMVGGLGVEHVLEAPRRPLVVLARRRDGDIQVSTRGTHSQVAEGLDLGAAVLRAAAAVDREGGGHPVAAGAVVPEARLEAFLAALGEALSAPAPPSGP